MDRALIYIDGEYFEKDNAKISVFDQLKIIRTNIDFMYSLLGRKVYSRTAATRIAWSDYTRACK